MLVGLATLPTFSLANGISDENPRVIRIHEKISQQTLGRLKLNLTFFKNLDPFPAGLIVLLDSPGGDGDVAMEIGRLLRHHHAHIFVTRRCDSACVFVLMGGVVRSANPGSVGVHSGRLTLMTHDGNVIKEIDASKSLDDAFQLTTYNSEIRKYLKEMGIPHGILDVMLANSPNRIYKLSANQLNQFNINGINEGYLNQRVNTLHQMGYLSKTTPEAFVQRSLSIPRQCAYVSSNKQRFINCYKWTLQGHSH